MDVYVSDTNDMDESFSVRLVFKGFNRSDENSDLILQSSVIQQKIIQAPYSVLNVFSSHMEREQTDRCQNGGELQGWVQKVKGLSKNQTNKPNSNNKTHRQRQQYGDRQKKMGVGGVGRG